MHDAAAHARQLFYRAVLPSPSSREMRAKAAFSDHHSYPHAHPHVLFHACQHLAICVVLQMHVCRVGTHESSYADLAPVRHALRHHRAQRAYHHPDAFPPLNLGPSCPSPSGGYVKTLSDHCRLAPRLGNRPRPTPGLALES